MKTTARKKTVKPKASPRTKTQSASTKKQTASTKPQSASKGKQSSRSASGGKNSSQKSTQPKRQEQSKQPARSSGASGQGKENLLMELFEHAIKDLYWAEKALTKAIPKMVKKAESKQLSKALQNHLKETEKQVVRLEKIFQVIGKKAVAKKCIAMEGLINEAEEIMSEAEDGPMRDAAIIMAAQKVEHYEIASYGTLRQFAQTLGLSKAVELLEATLEEEKTADETLTDIATGSINTEAAETGKSTSSQSSAKAKDKKDTGKQSKKAAAVTEDEEDEVEKEEEDKEDAFTEEDKEEMSKRKVYAGNNDDDDDYNDAEDVDEYEDVDNYDDTGEDIDEEFK